MDEKPEDNKNLDSTEMEIDSARAELESQFNTKRAEDKKDFQYYIDLAKLAIKLNDIPKLHELMDEFNDGFIIPSDLWHKYLQATLASVKNESDRIKFNAQCIKALNSYYDVSLVKFILTDLTKISIDTTIDLWIAILNDYGLERMDFIKRFRALYEKHEATEDQLDVIKKALNANCIVWGCSEAQLAAITQILEGFGRKLKESTQYTPFIHNHYIEVAANSHDLTPRIRFALDKSIFERCISKFPNAELLWVNYIDHQMKNEELVVKPEIAGCLLSTPIQIARRAVCRKPCIRLNHKLISVMESLRFQIHDVDEELKPVFQRTTNHMYMHVELHLDYLAYRVRNLGAENNSVVELRQSFQSTWNQLSKLYADAADTNFEILQLWAQAEYAIVGAPDFGAQVWEEILKNGDNVKKSKYWIGYSEMESAYNMGKNTVEILHRGLKQPGLDSYQDVLMVYRRYERSFGNSASIAVAQDFCNKRNRPPPQPKSDQIRELAAAYKTRVPKPMHEEETGGKESNSKPKPKPKNNPFSAPANKLLQSNQPRRMATNLIPTAVIRPPGVLKRRLNIVNTDDSNSSNGLTADSTPSKVSKIDNLPKKNDDFRKLFLKPKTKE